MHLTHCHLYINLSSSVLVSRLSWLSEGWSTCPLRCVDNFRQLGQPTTCRSCDLATPYGLWAVRELFILSRHLHFIWIFMNLRCAHSASTNHTKSEPVSVGLTFYATISMANPDKTVDSFNFLFSLCKTKGQSFCTDYLSYSNITVTQSSIFYREQSHSFEFILSSILKYLLN